MTGSPQSRAHLLLDRVNLCVHLGDRPLRLTPKAFEVLRYLMERPGRLVTKEELLAAVWAGTAVTDASLSTCIREIRRALDDDPAAPRYIQTVHRRGYRYMGLAAALDSPPAVDTTVATRVNGPLLVGRDEELAALDRSLRQVQRGDRRLTFLAGEAGIGKTALVEHFVARMAGQAAAHVARGQCVEQYGACEAYLPWLEALNHLAREHGRARLASLLRHTAPMWLAQLPWLIDTDERERLQREIAGATRERMVRELAEALEALAAERPVVLVLEDLHWSDPSSIGMLAYLARRRQPGRLLLLCTYRPVDLHLQSHPLIALKQELLMHGLCDELPLDFLTPAAVADYVASRLPGAPPDLAVQLHRRTDGNPLFMVNVIDYLLSRGALLADEGRWHLRGAGLASQTEVPENLKEMIERQLDRLAPDDRRVLEAASVAGATFSAAAVAAVLGEPVESAEERLGALARGGSFVRRTDRQIWPDLTHTDGYAFIHALYQNVLYERVGPARGIRMHRQVGERLEAGYRDRAGELAAELALHFQRGRDPLRAVRYLAQAGENAIRRSAYVEAIALLTQGVELVSTLPAGVERDACELQLQVPLGVSYVNTRGYAAPEVGTTFERAYALCRHVSDPSRLFRVLRGMWSFAVQRADLGKARAVAEELLAVAERERDRSGLVEGHRILGTTYFHVGRFADAREHLERGLALYDAQQHASHAFLYGLDPGVSCFAWSAWTAWYLGYPEQAAAAAARAVDLARETGHPFSLSYAMNFAAGLYQLRREPDRGEPFAREGIRVAHEQGLRPMLALGQILHGWSGTFLGRGDAAIGELEEGLARWQSTGARLMTPYWTYLLAAALNEHGRTIDARKMLDAAFAQAETTAERFFECELYILKGRLAVSDAPAGDGPGAPGECALRRALQIADDLASPALRLRAANALLSLARDRPPQGRDARDLVRRAYAVFTEGFETPDLADARAMLF